MSEHTKIEWCDSTFNPWMGCTKVSPACDHCYAERNTKRFGTVKWGTGQPRVRTAATNWAKPINWNKKKFYECGACGHRSHRVVLTDIHGHHTGEEHCEQCGIVTVFESRRRVFSSSLADWLDNESPIAWFVDFMDLIRKTPNLDWLLLTKRVSNFKNRMTGACNWAKGAGSNPELVAFMQDWLSGESVPPNVAVGSTVIDQDEANRDVLKLLDVPARVHFVSMEPLLGAVDLTRIVYPNWKQKTDFDPYVAYDALRGHIIGPDDVGQPKLDWVIVGGESGPAARAMNPDWARSLRDQCAAARVSFLFKQWGEWGDSDSIEETNLAHHGWHEDDPEDGGVPRKEFPGPMLHGVELLSQRPEVFRVGKRAAGRFLDGIEHNGFPEMHSS